MKDLILTRNPEVISKLLQYENGDFDSTVLLNDEEAHRTVAGLFKEIRDKEKAGVKLTEAEHKLKETLESIVGKSGSIVEKDEEGLQTMRQLGRNMAWMLKLIKAGLDSGISLPEVEDKIRTNFIR